MSKGETVSEPTLVQIAAAFEAPLRAEIARLRAMLDHERKARDIYERERGLTPFSEFGNAFAYYESAREGVPK